MTAQVVSLTPLSARYIAERMRDADVAEWMALSSLDQFSPVDAAAGFLSCAPHAWMALLDNEPVAMIAASQPWPGVWQVGMFATDLFPAVAICCTKFVVRDMIPFLRAQGAHRAHAFSMDAHADGRRWLEILGARRESSLTGYGRDGQDFGLYVWSDPADVWSGRQKRQDRPETGQGESAAH